jgi:hypothetical protein
MQQKAGSSRIERIHVGLMTVPMAVAASSAFPAFFPPLNLTGREVGARGGEFGQQAFTDGGIFDNLGVRMFRWLTPLLTGDQTLDGVLVSDVGKPFTVQANRRSGVIRTAMRASEVLMDRVWQLESENFQDTFGFVFARFTDIAGPHEDATAMHPEMQRQVAGVRTDLDAFSDLEISCLIRHGYCIGRKACRSRPDLFGTELPSDPPWDPVPAASLPQNVAPTSRHEDMIRDASPTTLQARMMQLSATRRIWSRFFTIRDWTSYIYVPFILLLLVLLPYLLVQSRLTSNRVNRLVKAVADGSPEVGVLSQLMSGPMKPFPGEPSEEVPSIEPPNYKGFSIFQDSTILDLRQWDSSDSTSLVYSARCLQVLKEADNADNNILRVIALASHSGAQFRFPRSQYRPELRRVSVENAGTQEGTCPFEVTVDLTKAPTGQVVDVVYECYSGAVFLKRGETSTTVAFRSDVDTLELTRWLLLPRGDECRSYQVVRYETGKPATAEVVNGLADLAVDDPGIIAFKMAMVQAGYTYEVTWLHE